AHHEKDRHSTPGPGDDGLGRRRDARRLRDPHGPRGDPGRSRAGPGRASRGMRLGGRVGGGDEPARRPAQPRLPPRHPALPGRPKGGGPPRDGRAGRRPLRPPGRRAGGVSGRAGAGPDRVGFAVTLWLARHAEAEWPEGTALGQADPELSVEGRRTAAALAATLGGRRLDRVIASDLRRARQTAAAVAGPRGVEVELWPELREVDFGLW